jgi:hypothetical protein
LTLAQQDVLRLDVAMDNAVSMGAVERQRHLAPDPDSFVQRQLGHSRQTVPETLPHHVGHCVPKEPGSHAGIEDRKDVRVLEAGRQLDLAVKSLRAERRGEVGVEHFESDQPIVLEISSEIDGRHAATAKFALDPVSAPQCFLEW